MSEPIKDEILDVKREKKIPQVQHISFFPFIVSSISQAAVKADSAEKVFLSMATISSLGYFINKKVGIWKN